MMPPQEEEDVLQNLEFAVLQVWHKNPEMTDHHVLRAYEAAFRLYRAEQRGHPPKPSGLPGLDAAVFEAIKATCEFRLGRGESPPDGPDDFPPTPLERLLSCLNRLARSVERLAERLSTWRPRRGGQYRAENL